MEVYKFAYIGFVLFLFVFKCLSKVTFQPKIDTKTTNQLDVTTELNSSAVNETIKNSFPFVFEEIQFRAQSKSKKKQNKKMVKEPTKSLK